jgi:hypothetical protein
MASLTDHLFVQGVQVALIREFVTSLGTGDCDRCEIAAAFTAVADSVHPLPLHLTWCVLWIMYVCPGAVFGRLVGTPPSMLRAWTGGDFRRRLELQLSGRFGRSDKKRSQARVEVRALSPLEMVDSAWTDCVFEVTKPPATVAIENGWARTGREASRAV